MRNLAALSLSAILFIGCGSDGTTTGVSTGGPGLQSPALQQATLGRAFFSDPVVNGRVLFFSLDGQFLGEVVTNRTGDFQIPQGKLNTTAYRAVLVSSGQTLRSEIRGPQEDMLTLSPLTTVVSYYLEDHPGISLREAENRVKAYLRLPNYTVSSMIGEMPFLSSKRLLAEADLPALAQAVDGGGSVRFVEDQGVTGKLGSETLTALSDFATDLGKDFLKSGATDLIGWVASSIGINFLSPSLRDIGKQLDQIANDINAVAALISQGAANEIFNHDLAELNNGPNGPAFLIKNKNADLTAVANTTVPTGLPVPASFLVNTAAGNLTSSLQMQTWQDQTDSIFQYLTAGSSGTNILRDQASHLLEPLGYKESDNLQFYPARSNVVFPPQQNALISNLLGVGSLGIILVGESAHLAANLAQSISLAQSYLRAKNIDTQRIRQEVPATLASSGVFLDMEYKKMWVLQIHDKASIEVATNIAEGYTIGPFSQFHVPNDDELSDLYDRQKAGNSSNPLQVLISLGFRGLTNSGGDVQVTDDGHHVLYDHDVTVRRRSLDTGHTELASDGAFMMVRDFPGNAEYDLAVNPLSCMTGKSMTLSSSPVGTQTQLKATGTSFRMRGGGTFMVGTSSHSNGVLDVIVNGSVDVTDQVIWTSGNDSQASVSNAQGSYGLVTWHVPLDGQTALSNVTITGQLHEATASVTLTPPAGLTPVLDSIQLSPFNVLYDPPTLGSHLDIPLRTTLFFKDPLTQDALAEDGSSFTNVTYQVFDTNSGQLVDSSEIGFPTVTPNLMRVFSSNTHANVTVNATIGTVTGSSPFGFSVLK